MNYDIQLKSELFESSKHLRTHRFGVVFESILNPVMVSTEAWEASDEKNLLSKFIDWIKRMITITIPAFFKNLFKLTPKISPKTNQFLNDLVKELEETADKTIQRKTFVDDITNDSSSKKNEEKRIEEINEELKNISEDKFKKLDANLEKRMKLASTKIKNVFEGIYLHGAIKAQGDFKKSMVSQISQIYNDNMQRFNKIAQAGSITKWKGSSYGGKEE